MKKLYALLITFVLSSVVVSAQPFRVVVEGFVKFSNGVAAPGRPVYISTDTTTNTIGCPQFRTKITDTNGFYRDTLTCPNGTFSRVKVSTYDCNQSILTKTLQVPPGNVVISNFTLSCLPPNICEASFTFTRDSLTIHYNSSNAHGISATDLIIKRKWRFGNGDTLGGNVINPSHTFSNRGTYQTCLTILTASGCEKTICKTIVIDPVPQVINRVIVKGYVVNASGQALANRRVVISIDSLAPGNICRQMHVKFTNANGYYIDTLTCLNNPITAVRVWTENCTGALLVNTHIVPASKVVESNFAICVNTTPPQCAAIFSSTPTATNRRLILFNSSNSSAPAGDQIVSRSWKFGDGSTLLGNTISPDHLYLADGNYNVCLRIATAAGCVREICKVVEVRNARCEAAFNFAPLPPTLTGYPVKFQSSISHAAPGDSIVERKWSFGNGTYATGSIDPIHVFTTVGTYNVCLIIRTAGGCIDTTCKTIQVPLHGQVYCNPSFTYTPAASNNALFNSSASTTAPGDNIITRIWNFGDGTTLTGNIVSPQHHFAQPGIYNVCLRIITANGCEKTFCKQVTSVATNANCIARFEHVRTAPKQVSFRSGMSWAPANDSIIERKWDFGDGSPILSGNVVNPIKNYVNQGIYTVCLKTKTISGCISSWCAPVRVQDTITNIADPILIRQMYPNPASVQLNTVVWSLHNNINAELAIYDIYGVKKWSVSKVLLQGNNYTVLPVSGLMAGPYFFRVTTMYGTRSKQFYKL